MDAFTIGILSYSKPTPHPLYFDVKLPDITAKLIMQDIFTLLSLRNDRSPSISAKKIS